MFRGNRNLLWFDACRDWRGDPFPISVPGGALINGITGVPLTADRNFNRAHLRRETCRSQSVGPALATCDAAGWDPLPKAPAPGKENDDHNPQRIAPRNLFDLSVGDDNLFHGDRYKWSLRLTAINVTNKAALYNFLSTFSGTHYVTPRSMTAEFGFHF